MSLWPFSRYALMTLFVASPAAWAIDCSRAQTAPERAICADAKLKAFDDYLTQAYADIRAMMPEEAFAQVRASQRDWIKARDARCGGDVACLMEETYERTAALNAFAQHFAEDMLGAQRAPSRAAPVAVRKMPEADADVPRQVLAPHEIYRIAARSVVVVMAQTADGDISQGSGVSLAPDLVATNCHVVEDAEDALVLFEGEPYKTQAILGDENLDYCMLVTEGLPAQTARIGALADVEPGQRVYSIGSPKGYELTIAEGLVSGMRDVEGVEMIQTSAAISHGSSGGGLFNEYGEVIGITTSSRKDAQNLNFALPVELAGMLLEQALEEMR